MGPNEENIDIIENFVCFIYGGDGAGPLHRLRLPNTARDGPPVIRCMRTRTSSTVTSGRRSLMVGSSSVMLRSASRWRTRGLAGNTKVINHIGHKETLVARLEQIMWLWLQLKKGGENVAVIDSRRRQEQILWLWLPGKKGRENMAVIGSSYIGRGRQELTGRLLFKQT